MAILPLIASGCAGGALVDQRELCAGTKELRPDHAAALAEDGGPRSVVTGRRLIATMDAGCRE
ncbi:hypothetical protein C2I36_09810 [Rhodobacteraceae bacterium WD3A24]|nr:hypothetical protein C2I36_09810 [Rhodobacteraceae bacterium WD3A24]